MRRLLPVVAMALAYSSSADAAVTCRGVTHTDLLTAYASCPANSTIEIDDDTTVTASQSFTTSGIEVVCKNNARVMWGVNVMVTLIGDDNAWRNCRWEGPGLGTNTSTALVFRGKRFTVERIEAYGFQRATDAGVIAHNGSVDSSGLKFRHNNFHDNAMRCLVSVSDGVQKDWDISDNYCANGVDIVPQPGGNADGMKIVDNQFTVNQHGFLYGACIQFLGGNVRPFGVQINGNQCINYGTTVWPGQNAYALGGYRKAMINDNIYRANGFVFGTNTYLFEVHGLEEGTVNGNVIETAVSATSNGEDAALAVEVGCRVTVNNNIVDGFGKASYANGIYVIGSASYSPVCANAAIVSGNVVRFKNGETGTGIHLECYSLNCGAWAIVGNVIDAPTTPGTFGIKVRNTGAFTFSKVLEGPNLIGGTQYGVVFGWNVGSVCHVPGLNTSTTGVTQPNPNACM